MRESCSSSKLLFLIGDSYIKGFIQALSGYGAILDIFESKIKPACQKESVQYNHRGKSSQWTTEALHIDFQKTSTLVFGLGETPMVLEFAL